MTQKTWIMECLKMFNISVSNNLYRESNGNLKSEANSSKKKTLSRGKNPKRQHAGRFFIAISNINYAT